MSGANPFSFAEAQSPFLNLYCEPREFLEEPDRTAFEPIAFFGPLAPDLHDGPRGEMFSRSRRGLKIYASFGTVIWRYYEAEALAALRVVSCTFTERDADVVISLGRRKIDAAARAALERPNVQVVD